MPEVQSIGAADYTMPVQQNQYAGQPSADDNVPGVYDPELEEKRKAASRGLGLSLLGTIIAAGIGVWAGHSWGKAGKSELKQANEAMTEVLSDIAKESKNVSDEAFGGFKNGKAFAKSVQEKAKPFIEEVEKTAEDAAKKAEEVAEEAANKAEEAAK